MIKYKALLLILIISNHATHTTPKTSFINQFIKPGDLVFDVGANIGNKAELYLACNARVICIEPQPACCLILKNKFEGNPHIIIEETALSFKPGFLELAVCSQANTISTFSSEWQSNSRFTGHYFWDKKITVKVTTLDELIMHYGVPQFCKIDVENYEFEVLQGLTQPIPYLSFEFAAETLHNTIKCISYLEELGYRTFNLGLGENQQLKHTTWCCCEELLDKLNKIIANNSKAWGDIYAKM